MNDISKKFRQQVIDHVELLSSLSEQLKYEKDVPIADVPGELICGFNDDLFHPKSEAFLNAFIEEEIRSLAELYGMICIASNAYSKMKNPSLLQLQKLPEWRAVVSFSKDLLVQLKNK